MSGIINRSPLPSHSLKYLYHTCDLYYPTLGYRVGSHIHFSISDNDQQDSGTKQDKNNKEETNNSSCIKSNKPQGNVSPEEPTTCCMSGCANCVWLEYAEKLTEYYKDGGEKSINEINEKISDPNIKAYLLHELRMRNKK